MKLYRMIENPQDGEMVQYLAVHVLRWRPEWGEPSVAFIEVDEEEEPDRVCHTHETNPAECEMCGNCLGS